MFGCDIVVVYAITSPTRQSLSENNAKPAQPIPNISFDHAERKRVSIVVRTCSSAINHAGITISFRREILGSELERRHRSPPSWESKSDVLQYRRLVPFYPISSRLNDDSSAVLRRKLPPLSHSLESTVIHQHAARLR